MNGLSLSHVGGPRGQHAWSLERRARQLVVVAHRSAAIQSTLSLNTGARGASLEAIDEVNVVHIRGCST